MHRTLLKGFTVVASTAAAMMVFGLGQASATQQEPNHGSADTAVAAAGGALHDTAAGTKIKVCIDLPLGLDGICVILRGLGQVGVGSAHNQR
jgi:hypothetical protein